MASEFVEYKSHKEFEKARPRWLKLGYHVASVSDVPQRAGLARYATLGLGALVIRPKSHVYVIYEK